VKWRACRAYGCWGGGGVGAAQPQPSGMHGEEQVGAAMGVAHGHLPDTVRYIVKVTL
jgi:hypothetical protein